ncbi:amino-acid permease inda1 [Phaffia rhodozyma]|uniref:Amino-acid permease inda1 n=1 Tax=Phaffia rhodozyma TaxID=264483 RepID=A0A0F7SGX4_PHARH|nr:amino-acid permease inda1 [Phaffia rhodozyma]
MSEEFDEKPVKLGKPITASHDVRLASDSHHGEIYDPSKESIWTRLGLSAESYKRAPGLTAGRATHGTADIDMEKEGNQNILQAKMKPRHLQMIAVGGSIGTGLFVGTGSALSVGGPAGVLIAWILIGAMLISVTQALGEMSIVYPVSGGFYTLTERMLDSSFAFAMGWNYFFQWWAVLPLEITVAVTTVQYWSGDSIPVAALITIFIGVIIIASIFGTLGFAEEEFWSSCLKLATVVMFIVLGIVLNCGGGPSSGAYSSYVGGRYWQNPGAFANGFKGVCSVFVTAAFSFAGTELVGLAASETPDPRSSVPTAIKATFWRITIIYITSLTIIGLLVPWDNENLYGGSGSNASPFVIVMDLASISGLNHFINAVICVSVLSIGLSCVYAGSRTLTALAETGYAPKMFTYIDKAGRPLYSTLAVLIAAPIAYVNVGATGDTVFVWLLALSGLSTLFTWLAICLCHIRFRRAWKVQGHSVEELPFTAATGVWGSWFGVVLIVLVLIAQFYIALWPVGGMADDPGTVAEDFFSVYLAAPIMILFYAIGFIWKRKLPYRARDIDLDTGRKSWLTVEEMRAYRAERAKAPFMTRMYRQLFASS